LLKGRNDASQWLSRIRDAALKDEKGEALDGAIKTVESFARN
jgi:indolepyruvate ferredoxin oxidoreductase beta subunit